MLQAELKGKIPTQESHEDVLTSNVFGTLYYLDRSTVWSVFAKEILGLALSSEESEHSEFQFWPYVAGRKVESAEPDLIINAGKTRIVVECKLGSELYEEQLEKEIALAREMRPAKSGDELKMLAISTDSREPEVVDCVRQRNLDLDVRWTNWQKFCSLFKGIAKSPDIDSPTKRMLGDVIELLEKKGLREFMGINDYELHLIKTSLEPQQKVYQEFCILRNVLLGELEEQGMVRNSKDDRVWREGCGRSPRDVNGWITRYLLADFKSEEWITDTYWFSHYLLFIKLLFTEEERPFWFGYRVENWGDEERVYMQGKAPIIAKFAQETEFDILIRETNDQKIGEQVFSIISPDALTEMDFIEDDVHTIEIARRSQAASIEPGAIVKALVMLRGFVNEKELLPSNIRC